VTSSAFTISEVAADWHESMVPQRIMWPSTAHANGQLDHTGAKMWKYSPKTVKISNFGQKFVPQGRLVCNIFRKFSALVAFKFLVWSLSTDSGNAIKHCNFQNNYDVIA